MTLRNADGKKSFIEKIFSVRERSGRKGFKDSFDSPEAQSNLEVESLFSRDIGTPMPNGQVVEPIRLFVATWNVGGKPPHSGLNLDDFLQIHDESDIYILGFQEVVPLNAGNVLVIEDNEPAAKWLTLINKSLNKSSNVYMPNCPTYSSETRSSALTANAGGPPFFQTPSLKKMSKDLRTESKKRLKTCNCTPEMERKYSKEGCFLCQQTHEGEFSSDEDDGPGSFVEISTPSNTNQMKYSLIVCKQMVGIFVTIWARKELVQHVGHLRISCISRGIMSYLGNKGCISVSMSIHQTSFCFVCSHLASGEKEGDELRRNSDVIEILKNTQFPKICKKPHRRMPVKILPHNCTIWLGDLNYRIALSYSETQKLVEKKDWDALFEKDQLKIERKAGRVFKGWKEGKICFAPTYKYSYDSDNYLGETRTSKNKGRTPAWCDRILWHGDGIQQLSYVRGESRFSDHRPVCATFNVNVGVIKGGLNKGTKFESKSSYLQPVYIDIE